MVKIKDKIYNFRRGFSWRNSTEYLIFHHIGPMPNFEVNGDVIHNWHRNRKTKHGRYWNGIGYHVVVLPNGDAEEGRPLDTVGAHTQGVNGVSIGCVIVGDFETSKPSSRQIKTCIELGWMFKDKYPELNKVGGHYTFANTPCPGKNFPLRHIREKIKGGRGVSREELSWEQKQIIEGIERLGDMGLLNNPKLWVEEVRKGNNLPDVVYTSLIERVATEMRSET